MAIDITQKINKDWGGLNQFRRTGRRNPVFEIVLLLLVLALFFWFVVRPKMDQLAGSQDTLAAVQQTASSLSKDLANLKALVEVLKNSPDEVAKLDEALPLENNNVRINQLITTLAKTSGVILAEINVASQNDAVVAGNKTVLQNPFGGERILRKINADVHVIGNFNQLVAFLQKLENNARIMDIRALRLGGDQDGFLDLKINLDLYDFGVNS